ncbi:methyltransferase type 11 [Trichoderma arundinaceum]|uniref:Methyltransferase type 11 n=1 Tax=Trichoderma arundinaceum TaxID=490622 RepID=A0A395ND68_TRIAR|nr:methyltransferase type 11 [Trichoderma arundinaceum]
MKREDIIHWQSQLDVTPSQALTTIPDPQAKPIINNQHQPLSPPKSRKRPQTMASSRSTPKRQRTNQGATPDGETPRAGSRRREPPPHIRSASPTTFLPPSSESQSTQSRRSSRSSPSKTIAALELNPEGIDTRVLSLTNLSLPPALLKLAIELENCSNGVGVISSCLQDEIKEQSKTDSEFQIFLHFMYDLPLNRDKLGPTPSIDDVTRLVQEAAECQASMQSETGWNMMVHWPLLSMAIYGPRKQHQLVGLAPCTVAKIIKEYLPTSSQAKMVDFCMYLVPEMEEVATNATKNLREILPYNVINHTEFLPFRNRPIAVSIETKKRGGTQPATAELQLGTWQAAQWKFLEHLVCLSSGSFDGLPFLPAVVVQGHDWSFVATTRENKKTVLWLEKGFGSTTSSLGVYKTVWGLQRLAQWAREEYWPWFKRNALGITGG